jgi:hypothetical protein
MSSVRCSKGIVNIDFCKACQFFRKTRVAMSEGRDKSVDLNLYLLIGGGALVIILIVVILALVLSKRRKEAAVTDKQNIDGT